MICKMKNKKAVSGIIATVFMIALVIAVVGIVWVVVNNLVSEQLEEAGTCLDALGEVTINSRYTCYNATAEELQFSIAVGDIDLNEVRVSISGSGKTETYEITREGKNIDYLTMYNITEKNIILANKTEAFTYRLNTSTSGIGRPELIQVYPILKGKQCDSSDRISEIGSCFLLLS